ncbi:MAG: CAP domain-containing protein [Cyanobacteria bacterium J06597_16]
MSIFLTSCGSGGSAGSAQQSEDAVSSAGQNASQTNTPARLSDASCSRQVRFFDDVFNLTNAERQRQGLSPLTLSTELAQAAQDHANDMANNNYFAHEGSNGSTPATRAKARGYNFSAIAENIGAGYSSPAEVVQGWLNSPGHRKNILNGTYTEIGLGFARNSQSKFGTYWSQVFGDRAAADKPGTTGSALPSAFENNCSLAQNVAESEVLGWALEADVLISSKSLQAYRQQIVATATPESSTVMSLLVASAGLLTFGRRLRR